MILYFLFRYLWHLKEFCLSDNIEWLVCVKNSLSTATEKTFTELGDLLRGFGSVVMLW